MSSRDVCSIISECAKNKVTVLKFGDLYVRFGPQAEAPTDSNISVSQEPSVSTSNNSDKEISEQEHEQINRENIEIEEIRTRESQIEELMITDPLAAEELLRHEELEEDVADDSEYE